MPRFVRRTFVALAFLMAWLAPSSFAQQQAAAPQKTPAVFHAVEVIGLGNIKHDQKGKVTLANGNLQFTSGTDKSEVPIASIEDVLTGTDSQRVVRGVLGTLSMFAPYEGGRFLSLFRSKIDTLTINYRDSDGGLHGVILTLSQGMAATLKTELVAQGAHTSVTAEDEAKAQKADTKKTEEKKP
jgi:hypothetical protein